MKKLDKDKFLVCLSGGQDSATCLLQAVKNYGTDNVQAVAFDYGQKHSVELTCAQTVAKTLGVNCTVLAMPALQQIGDSALFTDADVNAPKDGLPASFVPGRNIIFLSQAAALAYKLNCGNLVIGVSEADYSGYPDCRENTLQLLESALNAGMETDLKIVAPLLHKTKAQVWALARQSGGQDGVDLIREQTHTCYNGNRETKHEWGYGCGACPACQLRSRGYAEFIGGS